MHLELIKQVSDMQQDVVLAHQEPLIGMTEAAELLCTKLQVDLVAVRVFARGEPPASVLIAAHGQGADGLARCILARGTRADVHMTSLVVMDAAGAEARGPPEHVRQLYEQAGLRSLIQVPIGPAAAPLGSLLVARAAPHSLDDPWWQVRLHAAATGMLYHVRSPEAAQVAALLRVMNETQDPVELVSVLLQSARRYMLKASSLPMNVRLALLQPGNPSEALLFEMCASRSASQGSLSSPETMASPGDRPLASPADSLADVMGSHMCLAQTLLWSAIKDQQARFVTDVGRYLQTCPAPAQDVFSRSSDLVSSIVVVPLLSPDPEGGALGAIYFTSDTTCDFRTLQDPLMGFIQAVAPTLHLKLAGRAQVLEDIVSKAQRRRSSMLMANSPCLLSSFDSALDAGQGPDSPPGAGPAASAAAAASASLAAGEPQQQHQQQQQHEERQAQRAPAARHSPDPSGHRPRRRSRLNSEAMLQLVQRDLRGCGQRRRAELRCAPNLVVTECLGRGGFGTVYRGRWHKVAVAVKVAHARQDEREAMKDAVEMAVLSSVQHPNIVTVYSCLTDMVEEAADIGSTGSYCGASDSSSAAGGPGLSGAGGGAADGGCARMRYRRLQPDEDPEGVLPTFNLLVMEYCDRGTLRDAVWAGAFHRQLPSGATGVDLAAVLAILLDVAYAVQYLHALHIVHGDIKMENILMKSDPSRPMGVAPKLADFGLTKILSEGTPHAVNFDGAGTVTHLAPEMFRAGSKITTAVDAYAFGVVMCELYSRKRAFAGLPNGAIIEKVYREGLRPALPPAAPPGLADLARACWHTDPAARPAFSRIAERLEALLAAARGQP